MSAFSAGDRVVLRECYRDRHLTLSEGTVGLVIKDDRGLTVSFLIEDDPVSATVYVPLSMVRSFLEDPREPADGDRLIVKITGLGTPVRPEIWPDGERVLLLVRDGDRSDQHYLMARVVAGDVPTLRFLQSVFSMANAYREVQQVIRSLERVKL